LAVWKERTRGSIEMIPNAVRIAELAIDKQAQTLLMPVPARRQLNDLPDDLWTKISIEFYKGGADAVCKALEVNMPAAFDLCGSITFLPRISAAAVVGANSSFGGNSGKVHQSAGAMRGQSRGCICSAGESFAMDVSYPSRSFSRNKTYLGRAGPLRSPIRRGVRESD
jgi:hypothetical protein